MLQVTCIGHLGGDAEVKSSNGREFTAIRLAHADRWTDDAGQVHEQTTWVDGILNGRPNVFEYLKKGQQVFVTGTASLRVYSSAKDRCMKAGLTINIRQLELLGGKADEVPTMLFDAYTGAQVSVNKYYNAPSLARDESQPEFIPLVSRAQEKFVANRKGWISKMQGDE